MEPNNTNRQTAIPTKTTPVYVNYFPSCYYLLHLLFPVKSDIQTAHTAENVQNDTFRAENHQLLQLFLRLLGVVFAKSWKGEIKIISNDFIVRWFIFVSLILIKYCTLQSHPQSVYLLKRQKHGQHCLPFQNYISRFEEK